MEFNLLFVILLAWALSASAITIETVPVGNPGNAGVGSVGYNFRIGKYEVTNAQYTEFQAFGHGGWDEAYEDPKVLDWMLSQRISSRGKTAAVGQ